MKFNSPKVLLKLVFIVVFLGVAVLALLNREHLNFDSVSLGLSQLDSLGNWVPLIYILAYIFATVFMIPASFFTIAAGAYFGPFLGLALSLTGAGLASLIAFLLSRYLFSDWVERSLGGKLKSMKQGIDSEGWVFVAFTRLVPLVPFNVLNYALGLTSIRVWPYFLTTILTIIPGAALYTYLGYAGAETVQNKGSLSMIPWIIALVALLLVVPRWFKKYRAAKALKSSSAEVKSRQ